MKPVEITDGNFESEVLKSSLPVLIDFWAVWCGPCRLIAPIVEELAGEYSGKLKIGKLDVDNNQKTAMDYGIRSIPTLLIFSGGQEVGRIVGAVPKQGIVEKLKSFIAA
jgi:thioredoxin 1